MLNPKLDRRTFVGAGAAGGLLGAFARTGFALPPQCTTDKLLVIFLRGAYDAVNSVIPFADPEYTLANRGPTYIDPMGSPSTVPIPGSTDFELNPAMAPLNPVLQAGRIVFLHAVGNPNRTGSHFEDQRTWETAVSQCDAYGADSEEGWIARLRDLKFQTGFKASSISTGLQQLFQTRDPQKDPNAHIKQIRFFPSDAELFHTLSSYNPALAPYDDKLADYLGTLYGDAPSPAHALDGQSRKAGTAMIDSINAVEALASSYVPLGGAKYPFGKAPNDPSFPNPTDVGLMSDNPHIRKMFANLRDAVWLLRKTSAQVVGIELGGFDTHSNQGSYAGPLAERLEALAYGLNSVDVESQDAAFELDSLTTLVVSEFGRTSKVNGSGGTDHGGATCVWVAGSRVKPDQGNLVFNEASWPGMLSANHSYFGCQPTMSGQGNYVDVVTDFRAVYGEVLKKIFRIRDPAEIEAILPGYGPLGLKDEELNFLTRPPEC